MHVRDELENREQGKRPESGDYRGDADGRPAIQESKCHAPDSDRCQQVVHGTVRVKKGRPQEIEFVCFVRMIVTGMCE
jgi:hypothetical protein